MLGCIYRPHDNDRTATKSLIDSLKWAKSMVKHEGYKGILVCGDLNYPGINWIEGCGGISVKDDDNLFLE